MKTLVNILWGMLIGLSTTSCFADSNFYVALDNGYRWDKISNHVSLGGPTATVQSSTQLLRQINSYQLGARGQWDYNDCLFVRADGHYGWVGDGKYSEGGFFGNSRGHTSDIEGAIGSYFLMHEGIWIAPFVGWSYDSLQLKGEKISTAINGQTYHLSDIKAHQRFLGPFLGFDLLFQPNDCFTYLFAYEFHFSNWHGERLIQGHEYGNPPFGWTTGFSNVRNLNRVYGSVFRLEADYELCDCWTVGLELKYKFYSGDNGKYSQTRRPLLKRFTYANVDGLWWRSFAATVSIGKVF